MKINMSARGGSALGGKKYILIYLVANLFVSWVSVASAQAPSGNFSTSGNYQNSGVDSGIKTYLCAPTESPAEKQINATGNSFAGATDPAKTAALSAAAGASNPASGDLYMCINKLYKFALVIASVGAVAFIVIAGYIYINSGGNEESISKAKDILASSLTALVILFIGYIFLKALNPDLIQFRSIQPPSVKSDPTACPQGSTLQIDPGTQAPRCFANVGNGAVGTTIVTGAGALSYQDAKNQLAANNITENGPASQTDLAGMKQTTVNELINLEKTSGIALVVTGGTEQGHSETGTCTHSAGYKVDIRPSTQLDSYIKSNYTFIGNRSGDNAPQYKAPDGAVYAREGDHWDIKVGC